MTKLVDEKLVIEKDLTIQAVEVKTILRHSLITFKPPQKPTRAHNLSKVNTNISDSEI